MSKPLLVIAAGGTGGHMFPAQSLAEEMLARDWRVKLSTDERGARYTQGFPDAVHIERVASATFARGGIAAKLVVPFRILSGVRAARAAFRADPPAVVVGFGGYPSIPALGAACWMRLPRMIHEQNGVLGRVNKVFATRVHQIACGTWPTVLPSGVQGHHIGNPVRTAIKDKAASPYIAPGNHPMEILVTGGSQGARVLSDVVPHAVAGLPMSVLENLTVYHQARAEDLERVSAYYAEQGVQAIAQPFFHDMPARIANAQLVIARAGASTVADLSVIGRPSILIPYAAATGDHQTANARGLVDAGAALVIQETDLDVNMLSGHINAILADSPKATQMAHSARTIARPDAAKDLANMVQEMAKGQTST